MPCIDRTLAPEPVAVVNKAYFAELLPLFDQIKSQADEILQMNQKNMSDANDRARHDAATARRRMYILLAVGTALAVVFIFFTRRWILRPIHRLIRSADEIRRGNLDLVVASDSHDEIGQLSGVVQRHGRQSARVPADGPGQTDAHPEGHPAGFRQPARRRGGRRPGRQGRGGHRVGPLRLRAQDRRERRGPALRLAGRSLS
ncbi:MAG: methyl-accepting chemotaxis protein [Comamonadaceae bacterium]|nr:methyl-accepting chemotaxis protein [Comamonadaceae bacterium]